jgi:hypothetical protein
MALDFGNAISGAVTGGTLGSFFPGIGTGIGALAGGALGLFGIGGSKKPKIQQQTTMTPEQSMALKQYYSNPITNNPLYQQGNSYLMDLLSNDPSALEAFAAPMMQRFNEQIVPGIAERFAGMGTGGSALSSSGLNQSLAYAARGLGNDLGAQRAALQQFGLSQALPYAQQPYANQLAGLGIQSFQPYMTPGSQGLFGPIASGLAGGASQGLGSYLGNYLGTNIFGSQYKPTA